MSLILDARLRAMDANNEINRAKEAVEKLTGDKVTAKH